MKKTHIIIHHSAVSRTKNSEQFDAIDRYHKSKGWGQIGYTYLIEPSGIVKTGRDENKNGAHCYQKLMNYRSIGICLTGNFDIEDPTHEQVKSLYSLIKVIQDRHKIKDKNVLPHRHYATYKSCPGNLIPSNIFGYMDNVLTQPQPPSEWAKGSIEKAEKKGISGWTDPQEPVNNNTLYHILLKLGKKKENETKTVSKEELIHLFDKEGWLD